MKRGSISIFMIVLFCLIMAAAVHAQGPVPVLIPNYINYQGKLAEYSEEDPERAPIPANGTYTMTFRIYDAEDAPIEVPLWEETHLDVNVEIGIFNVLLGEFNPLYLRFEQDYWLGLEVYPDYEMSPRQRIVSTAYSFMSQDSYSLNGYESGAGNGLNVDMVDGINASYTPGANRLLALDGSAEFPNSVLKMGEGRGLDADTVDGVHAASDTPEANRLLALDGSAEFPNSVLKMGEGRGLDADTVDGIHAASDTPEANKLLSLDTAKKFPNSVLYMSEGNGLDADMLDGKHASYFAVASHTHNFSEITGTINYANNAGNADKLDGHHVGILIYNTKGPFKNCTASVPNQGPSWGNAGIIHGCTCLSGELTTTPTCTYNSFMAYGNNHEACVYKCDLTSPIGRLVAN